MKQSDLYGSSTAPSHTLDSSKVAESMKRQVEESSLETDAKKRKYNSMHADVDISPEDMEAYRKLKGRGNDVDNISSDTLMEYKK